MDRHLNAFRPYSLAETHEDQLTRAAMIVLRAIPLARTSLLGLLDAGRIEELPAPDCDIQARNVGRELEVEGETQVIGQLISVFLSPDEKVDFDAGQIVERELEQRLDGVVRFGDELVIVIESKVVGKASTQQATELRLRGAEVEQSRVVALGWHDLLLAWWNLVESDLLNPTERVLFDDFFEFAEGSFAHLLPFTTIAVAGDTKVRIERRLMSILRQATGLEDLRIEAPERIGSFAFVPGAESTQRVSLQREADELVLRTWPAELKPQALRFYDTSRVDRVLDLIEGGSAWSAKTNLHLAYRGAKYWHHRLYPECTVGFREYVERWSREDRDRIGAYKYSVVESELWPWLLERGYATVGDTAGLQNFMEMLKRRDAHLRPGIQITRTWPWNDAVAMDEKGHLVEEVRQEISTLLTALDEPLVPGLVDD